MAAGLAWRLRFRLTADTLAWRRGARRTAHRPPPGPPGAARLGGPARPGHPRLAGQHRPPGHRPQRGGRDRLQALPRPAPLDPAGLLWHGRHLLVPTLRKVRWEADQVDEVLGVADVQVVAIMAVHGANVPWGRLHGDGVTVAPARRMPDLLQALPADPWPRAGGLAGRPGPAAVPRRRLTASPDQRSRRRCFRGFTGPAADALDRVRSAAPRRTALLETISGRA